MAAHAPAKAPSPLAIGCGALGLLVIVIVGVAILSSALLTPRKATIPIGTQAHVQNATKTVMLMALNDSGWGKISKAAAANDKMGAQQIFQSGEFVEITSGTSVLILGWNLMDKTTNVRVLSGNQSGKTGWVFDDYVVP